MNGATEAPEITTHYENAPSADMKDALTELRVVELCLSNILSLADALARARVSAYLASRFALPQDQPEPAPLQPDKAEAMRVKVHEYQVGFNRLGLKTYARHRLIRTLRVYLDEGYCKGVFEPTGYFMTFDEWCAYHYETKGRDLSASYIGTETRKQIVDAIAKRLTPDTRPAHLIWRDEFNKLPLTMRAHNRILNGLDSFLRSGYHRDAFVQSGVFMPFDEWAKFHSSTGGKELIGFRGMGEATLAEILHCIRFYLDEKK